MREVSKPTSHSCCRVRPPSGRRSCSRGTSSPGLLNSLTTCCGSAPHLASPIRYPAAARVREFSDDVLLTRSAPGVPYPLPRGCLPTFLPDGVVVLIRKRLGDHSGG